MNGRQEPLILFVKPRSIVRSFFVKIISVFIFVLTTIFFHLLYNIVFEGHVDTLPQKISLSLVIAAQLIALFFTGVYWGEDR